MRGCEPLSVAVACPWQVVNHVGLILAVCSLQDSGCRVANGADTNRLHQDNVGLSLMELQPRAASCCEPASNGASVLLGSLHGAGFSQAMLTTGRYSQWEGGEQSKESLSTSWGGSEEGEELIPVLWPSFWSLHCLSTALSAPDACRSPHKLCYSLVAVFANLKKMYFQYQIKCSFQPSAPTCLNRTWTGGRLGFSMWEGQCSWGE